jgi:hypothetical protein
MMPFEPTDDLSHVAAATEEWVFAAWTPDGDVGCLSGHRLLGRTAWYWSGFVQAGQPLLHLTEWSVRVRANPFVVKAPEMWAEHHCVAPMEQWSVGNEGYAVSLDDPDEAMGRGYGIPTPMSFDLEWYATDVPTAIDDGYEQLGVVHGIIEVLGRPTIDMAEIPAHRWHRWSEDPGLPPLSIEVVVAHSGLRAGFAFPDGSVSDLVLSPRGWRSRVRRRV